MMKKARGNNMKVIDYIIQRYIELNDDGFNLWNQAYKEFMDWFALQKIYLDQDSNFLKEELSKSRSRLDSLVQYSYTHSNKKVHMKMNLERVEKLKEIQRNLEQALIINRLTK